MKTDPNGPTTLYRAFCQHGMLLYVGISRDALRRLHQHEKKFWWHSVANITIQHFPDHVTARAAELEAIRTEKPVYNLAGPTAAAVGA